MADRLPAVVGDQGAQQNFDALLKRLIAQEAENAAARLAALEAAPAFTAVAPIAPPWANFHATYAQVGYFRHKAGLVIVQGLLTWTVGSGAPLNIGTFPAPKDGLIHVFGGQQSSGGGEARIDLSASGVLSWQGGGSIGIAGYLTLDGIVYQAAAT